MRPSHAGWSFLLLAACLLATAACTAPPPPVTEEEAFATVLKLEGEADALRPGADWEPLKAGATLPEGTRIFTGMDSKVEIALQGGGVFELEPLTEILIDRKTADLRLSESQIHGEVRVRIEKGDPAMPSVQVNRPNNNSPVISAPFRADEGTKGK